MAKQTSEIMLKQALDLISPRSDKLDDCRAKITQSIKWIVDDSSGPSPRQTKTRLTVAAKLFSDTADAFRALPRSRQHWLLLPQTSSLPSPPLSVGSLYDLVFHAPQRAKLRVENFLRELEYASMQAKAQSKGIIVPRAGGRPNYRKQAAAWTAHLLMRQFGQKRPTLTVGGPFFHLASVLYEAATGEPDVDLSRQCRSAFKAWRKFR
jgi:hypothetical protein